MHKTRTVDLYIKAAGPDEGLAEGQFLAYASVFDNVDSDGDITRKGAFLDTLAEWAAIRPLQKSGALMMAVASLALSFLLENLRLNRLPPMKYRHGPWLAPAVPAQGDLQGEFDLLIGSDVLYERDDDATLAGFIQRHAAAAAEVWIVDPDRGNRPAFNRAMAARGFDREELRLAHALPLGAGTLPHYKGRLLLYRRGLPALAGRAG